MQDDSNKTQAAKQEFTEAPQSVHLDVYYKGFHAGLTVRATDKGIVHWQNVAAQAQQVQFAVDDLIVKGFEPSWNKETNNGHLKTETKNPVSVEHPTFPAQTKSEIPNIPNKKVRCKTCGKGWHDPKWDMCWSCKQAQ